MAILFLFQIYKDNELYYYIDGYDTSKANWMRYVNPAYSSESQNLIACQYKMNIYFYTIKPILPNQELLVWYCKEFAERLNYPLTGEQMLQRIRKSKLIQLPRIMYNKFKLNHRTTSAVIRSDNSEYNGSAAKGQPLRAPADADRGQRSIGRGLPQQWVPRRRLHAPRGL